MINKQQQLTKSKCYNKEIWIEYLRTLCILSVIMNHTCMTIINNSDIDNIGLHIFIVLDEIFMLVRFAVPCFLMISGYLLLNRDKQLPVSKLMRYTGRMFLVLLFFGTSYSILEIVITSKSISVNAVLQGFLNMLEGNSWSHMWYIYMLIGLYIITPVLKAFIAYTDEKTQRVVLIALYIGNCAIPMINNFFDINIENYMVLDVYVMYYLLGGYLRNSENFLEKREKPIYCLGITVIIISCISELLFLLFKHETASWNHGASNLLTPLCALAVFVFFMKHHKTPKNTIFSKLVLSVASCSFAMYLIHPVFINLTYKMIHISPMNFSPLIFCGILAFFIVFTVISYIISWIMKKIPLLKKLI